MDSFYCKTKIYSGSHALSQLQRMEIRRLFLVTDPYFMENKTADRVVKLTGAEDSCIFHKVTPDPSVELAAEGTAMLREFSPDAVVALGGGSAIDCAKAMVYFSKMPVRFIAIPTTSGSGSEVTDFAVLTHGETKHPLVDPSLCPEAAILDSSLLAQLPKTLIADCGFDVLCHAMEAFVAKDASCFTDALAKESFCTALSLLPASYGGCTEVRLQIHRTSTMAGLAFTHAGLGLCHAMAHSLGGITHLPHGRLNAILMPAVMDVNLHVCGEKYARLSRFAGLGGAADTVAVRNLKNALIRLRKEMGMPKDLKEAGFSPLSLYRYESQIIRDTLSDPCCRNNPMPVEDYMVRKVLGAIVGNGY